MSIQPEFPFTAVTGPRGTAKPTLARGLAGIAASQKAFVNLPLGASEEMLIGTLDLQKALGDQSAN